MTITCRQFARSVAGGTPGGSETSPRRFFYWWHWLICPFCRRYWTELRMIRDEARKRSAAMNVDMEKIKDRLKERLRREPS